MPKHVLLQASCCILFAFITAKGFTQSKDEYAPCQEMPNLMQNYNADYAALQRFYTATSGNGFGGGFRGGRSGNLAASPERSNRLQSLYKEYLGKLQAINFKNLTQECKVDYILFKRDLNQSLELTLNEAKEYDKIKQWFPFADKIYDWEKKRRRGIQLDAEQVGKDLFDMTEQIKTLQAKLRDEKGLSPESVWEAGAVADYLKTALTYVYEFYNGYDPMFSWWVPKSYQGLSEALTAYSTQLKAKNNNITAPDKSGIVGKPAGREELIRQLQYEMIPYTPEDLIDIANKEFAWCDAEMLKASKEMGFGDNWKAALEKVKNTYVPAGKQPEMILDLFNQSVDFLKKHDLITIPPLAEEVWGMRMMSPEQQLTSPFFLGGNDIIISYPTNAMDEDDRLMSMRGNNPHFSRATVHHELIAGHNLQQFMNSRYRTYRNYSTPFWTEGWSLYWELLLWDMNFPRGPEDRIGMLFWHMHRCARIIFSLNYHMGKWTPQQCIDFLVDRVGHERANAEGEVRRSFTGNYPPLYQLAYLTGGRQFYALHKELVESKKMTNRQFHDAIMHLNAMPVEMVRAILTNQPLTPDFKTGWKFYSQQELPGKKSGF
ncbi:MAG: DUF885 family protein [Williamsia sp.]|nr:DUF885 family protein [Williamsia sp.]